MEPSVILFCEYHRECIIDILRLEDRAMTEHMIKRKSGGALREKCAQCIDNISKEVFYTRTSNTTILVLGQHMLDLEECEVPMSMSEEIHEPKGNVSKATTLLSDIQIIVVWRSPISMIQAQIST